MESGVAFETEMVVVENGVGDNSVAVMAEGKVYGREAVATKVCIFVCSAFVMSISQISPFRLVMARTFMSFCGGFEAPAGTTMAEQSIKKCTKCD